MKDFQSMAAITVVIATLLVVIYFKWRHKGIPCDDCCCPEKLGGKKSPSKSPKK